MDGPIYRRRHNKRPVGAVRAGQRARPIGTGPPEAGGNWAPSAVNPWSHLARVHPAVSARFGRRPSGSGSCERECNWKLKWPIVIPQLALGLADPEIPIPIADELRCKSKWEKSVT